MPGDGALALPEPERRYQDEAGLQLLEAAWRGRVRRSYQYTTSAIVTGSRLPSSASKRCLGGIPNFKCLSSRLFVRTFSRCHLSKSLEIGALGYLGVLSLQKLLGQANSTSQRPQCFTSFLPRQKDSSGLSPQPQVASATESQQ